MATMDDGTTYISTTSIVDRIVYQEHNMEPLTSLYKESQKWLKHDLNELAELLWNGSSYIRLAVEAFNNVSHRERMSTPGVFSRVCSVSVAKAYRFLLGLYYLNLHGLAQESGALLRPTIEIIEQLIYFRYDSARVYEAVEERLPSAGQIAKQINGEFKDLREYCNESASHFSFTWDSVRHLIDVDRIRTIPDPRHSLTVFPENLVTLLIFHLLLLNVTVECLNVCGYDIYARHPEMKEWAGQARETCENKLLH